MNDLEKQVVERLQREFDREQALLDQQHQQKLNRMRAETNRYVYNTWLNTIIDYIEADVKPTASLKKDIKKAGIDFESLYRDASRKVFHKRVAYIKEQMYEHLAKDATVLRDYITNVFNWDADYCEQIINDVLESMQTDYVAILDKILSDAKTDLDIRQLSVISGMLDKSVEDVKQDLIKRKAELEQIRLEEERKQREEKERQRIAQNKAIYEELVKEAIDKMVDNVNQGVEFITNYKNISEILSDVKVSLDDCINEAKAEAEKKRLKELNQNINWLESRVKAAYKERNNVGYHSLGSFALGLIFASPFFLIVGICVLGITYFKHTKAEKVRKELGELIAKRDGVEFDPSINSYELPIVAKIIKQIKEKKNKK